MRLRTFTARDMPSAMKMVRDALGDNAIILTTESHKGKKGIIVTAAIDNDSPSSDAPAAAGDIRQMDGNSRTREARSRMPDRNGNLHFEIQNILRFHNIPEHFVAKILQKASAKDITSLSALHHISANRDEKPLLRLAMEKILSSYLQFSPLSLDDGKLRIMLVGPPGIGKTLTIAKLAAQLAMSKKNLAVFTADNQRAGGVEQLQAFTDILELPLHVATSQTDLSRQLKKLPQNTQVLIDTAGCNPYDNDELKALKSLAFQKDIEPVMVLQAGGDSAETIDIVETFAALPIKRLMITRADTARRFGGVVAAAAAHKLALCNVSSSSSIINTLEAMDGGLLARMLLRYQLQSR